jgi:hypothetical protein
MTTLLKSVRSRAVNINKDENKSLLSNQFSLKNDVLPHFLENYFAELKVKNDHKSFLREN